MKHTVLKLAAVLAFVAFASFCAFAGIEASGAPEPRPELRHTAAPRTSSLDVAADAPIDPKRARLAAYTLGVMRSWPRAIVPAASYEDIADDIAAAVLVRPSAEPSADAILLAGLGFWEGARFANYVDKGWCNDPGWRQHGIEEQEGVFHRSHQHGVSFLTSIWTSEELMHTGGDCDSGNAHSIWQVWFARDPSSPIYKVCSKHALTGSSDGVGAAADRRAAAICALEIARADTSLCGYAGERASEGCPKGEQRRKFVLDALAKHPFVP